MDKLFYINWQEIFVPSNSIAEIVLRGSLIYLGLVAILRLVLKRESGAVGITDLVVVVLIADAAQNGMANDYKSITEGLILVSTIVFWCYLIDWLGYKFPAVQRFVRPAPLLLIKNGRMIRRNMRRELITEGELMNQLRQQGIEDINEVKQAYMEADGRISAIARDSSKNQKAPERRTS